MSVLGYKKRAAKAFIHSSVMKAQIVSILIFSALVLIQCAYDISLDRVGSLFGKDDEVMDFGTVRYKRYNRTK
jgi:hypothetical protein